MLPCVPLAVVQQNRATSYRHINKKTPKPSNCVLKKEKKKRDLWKSNALTVVSGALSVLGGLAPGLRSDETNVWNETSYHVSLNTAHVCNNQHCLGSGATANLHFRLWSRNSIALFYIEHGRSPEDVKSLSSVLKCWFSAFGIIEVLGWQSDKPFSHRRGHCALKGSVLKCVLMVKKAKTGDQAESIWLRFSGQCSLRWSFLKKKKNNKQTCKLTAWKGLECMVMWTFAKLHLTQRI